VQRLHQRNQYSNKEDNNLKQHNEQTITSRRGGAMTQYPQQHGSYYEQ
jgi:hypothetical protein